MPSEARGSRLRVPADLQFELKTLDAQSQRLQSSAAEGPSEAVQLADHRDRGLVPFDDVPCLVEAKTVYGRWRKVRFEPHFSAVRGYRENDRHWIRDGQIQAVRRCNRRRRIYGANFENRSDGEIFRWNCHLNNGG